MQAIHKAQKLSHGVHRAENQQNTSSTSYKQDVPLIGQAATDLDFEIYVYIGLVGGAVVLGGLQAALFYALARRAGTVLHDRAVSALFSSPLGFFQANSRGKAFVIYYIYPFPGN